MPKKSLIIATRQSPLALWQANWVKAALEKIHPVLEIHLLAMTTQADRMPYVSLTEIGGKGLFVKELEEALLDGRADMAVHCVKDMPMDLPPGLSMPVMCEREDPWDVMVSNKWSSLDDIPTGAVVGTSSLRRRSLLLAWRPDVMTEGLRGNVNTRLARLDKGDYDAIILAAAGLQRLGLEQRITQVFNSKQFLPAPGQGILGLECRSADAETQALITPLNDEKAFICGSAERALCRRLEGGCQVPIASFAEIKKDKIFLRGLVANLDGTVILRAQCEGKLADAEKLGISAADDLLAQGAAKVLKSILKSTEKK
jgi:hydroxymethylbilane synthase